MSTIDGYFGILAETERLYTILQAHFDGDYIAVRAHRQEISLLALACDLLVVRAWPAFNVPC